VPAYTTLAAGAVVYIQRRRCGRCVVASAQGFGLPPHTHTVLMFPQHLLTVLMSSSLSTSASGVMLRLTASGGLGTASNRSRGVQRDVESDEDGGMARTHRQHWRSPATAAAAAACHSTLGKRERAADSTATVDEKGKAPMVVDLSMCDDDNHSQHWPQVCVCVCEREREREGMYECKRETDRQTEAGVDSLIVT
jgi:hypothetical protein